MISAFLSRYGIRGIKVGSPVLAVLEAGAQSDVRSAQDTFSMLDVGSLERATGSALDRYGADENTPRVPETASSGFCNVTDSTFTKKSTRIYQGLSAPIVGSSSVNVLDTTGFPISGSIYIGRNTINYEGPLAYGSITATGSYFTINLVGTTQKYHNLNETVVLAQGGLRTITAGTLVQTASGSISESSQFKVLYAASIPDGEVTISNISIVCTKNGIVGNVGQGAIIQFPSLPFTGATVTNALPIRNGLPAEDDNTYRERIRSARASRNKGTPTAIKTSATGVVSFDENKRVASANVLTRAGSPTAVYIDDGTGYEERNVGVATESIVSNAIGGEPYFQLAQQPVAKAFNVSLSIAPFVLTAASVLSVKIGGFQYNHTFPASDFKAVGNASAYEVASSINADSSILFSARTVNGGQSIVLFARAETNDSVEVVPAAGIDANIALSFPVGRVDTLRLYKNDRLLTKDGALAYLNSGLQSAWGVLSSGETLTVSVDGTPATTYTFNDIDFINANTGFITLSRNNSLASWAAVFNAKLPGVTTSVNAGSLLMTSNAGAVARAALSITGGTLSTIGKSMFTVSSLTGLSNDYVLDRNRSQLTLTLPLSANDRLTSGTTQTSAFIESGVLGNVSPNAGQLWFVVDGAAQIVPTAVTGTTSIAFVAGTFQGVPVTTVTAAGGFTNLSVGDWIILWDPALNAANVGSFRVNQVTANSFVIEATGFTQTLTLPTQGIVVVRTNANAQLQRVVIPLLGGGYTASTLAVSVSSQLVGATSYVYRTNKLRVATNTNGTNGDVALVAVDVEGKKLLLPTGNASSSLTSHIATIESLGSELTTPNFLVRNSTNTNTLSTTPNSVVGMTSGSILVGGFQFNGPTNTGGLWGNLHGKKFYLQSLTGGVATPRTVPTQGFYLNDGLYSTNGFGLTATDTLTVVVDGDISSKRYTVPMFRRLKTVGTTYSAGATYKDVDNSNASLVAAFGAAYDFSDFAIYMNARTVALPATTSAILFRYYLYGVVGNSARVRFVYPAAPSLPVAVTVDDLTTGTADALVALPSGATRNLSSVMRTTTRVGLLSAGPDGGGVFTLNYIFGYASTSGTRDGANNTTLTLTLAPSTALFHGMLVGDVVWVNTNSNPNFSSGAKTITAATTTTIVYTEVAAAIGATAITATVSADSAGEVILPGFGANDIVNVTGAFSSASDPITVNGQGGVYGASYTNKIGRINGFGSQYLSVYTAATLAPTTAGFPFYRALGTINAFVAYPIDTTNNLATQIATSVNALAALPNSTCPVTAVAVGNGTSNAGSILLATYDALDNPTSFYSFSDGIQYILSSPAGADYTLNFKDPVTAALATNSDWANEQPRLGPITAAGVVKWLNTSAVSGLFSTALVAVSSRNNKLQISSNTQGSVSSVQVQNSPANSVVSAVVGSAAVTGTGNQSVHQITSTDAINYAGGSWVSLQNSVGASKGAINSLSQCNTIDALGNFTFDLTGGHAAPFTFAVPVLAAGSFNYERQGNFILVAGSRESGAAINLSTLTPGSYINISSAAFAQNSGNFRVVAVDPGVAGNGGGVWIENANATEAQDDPATVQFTTSDSVQPGDQLIITSAVYGVGNQGTWIVKSVDYTSAGAHFVVDVSQTVTTPYAGSTTLVAAGAVGQVYVREATGSKLIRQIISVSPNAAGTLADVKLNGGANTNYISSGLGTVMSALDKFNFPTSLKTGIDSYSYSVGLIGQVNTVLYGSAQDPVTYPGVVAAGAQVNILGPLVRRIQISLAVRIGSGSRQDISDQVKSRVASAVNSTAVGQSVALSDIVAAASKVAGVVAISIISPTYSSNNDLINVQPYEKALVLNLDTDVLLNFVGDF